MRDALIIGIFLLAVVITYLTRFRSKNIFQATKEEVWFPFQPHQNFYIGQCNAWLFDNNSDRIILYCHGNYGNMYYYSHVPFLAKRLGLSLLMFDYRGFGASGGIATTENIKDDGLDVYDWLLEHYDEDNIIVWGESLGGSIAAWIAANNKPSKVMLVSTFSDIHDVLRMHGKDSYLVGAVIAVADLLYDSLPIKQWIKEIRSPLCIVHSLEDTYIPYTCATINAKASKTLVEFIPIRGDHTTPIMTLDDINRISRFLETSVNSTDVINDFKIIKEHSPLCRL